MEDDVKDFLLSATGSGGSNNYLYKRDGFWYPRVHKICFAELTQSNINTPITDLCIAFNKSKCMKKDRWEYMNWILKLSPYRDAFLTKDVSEGAEKGFWLDVSKDKNLVFSGMIALRMAFENTKLGPTFGKLLGMGYDYGTAYGLSCNITLDKNIQWFMGNPNHLVIYPGQNIDLYSKELEVFSGQSLSEGNVVYESGFWLSRYVWGCEGLDSNFFFETRIKDEIKKLTLENELSHTKENVDKILTIMKGKN